MVDAKNNKIDPNENWQKSGENNAEQVKWGSPSVYWTSGLEYRLQQMKNYIDFKGKKVLDIGCGVGMFMHKFQELGAEVYGVDVDEKKIELARKTLSNVQISGGEKLPFPDNTFDLVFLHEVIEHVDDDRQTIIESFRVLKRGGVVIIFAPNRLFPFETHGIYWNNKYKFGNIPLVTYLPDSFYKKLTPHVRNYTRKQILDLFEGLDYQVLVKRRVLPGFDKAFRKIPLIGGLLKKVFNWMQKTPISVFGVSHFLIVEKTG